MRRAPHRLLQQGPQVLNVGLDFLAAQGQVVLAKLALRLQRRQQRGSQRSAARAPAAPARGQYWRGATRTPQALPPQSGLTERGRGEAGRLQGAHTQRAGRGYWPGQTSEAGQPGAVWMAFPPPRRPLGGPSRPPRHQALSCGMQTSGLSTPLSPSSTSLPGTHPNQRFIHQGHPNGGCLALRCTFGRHGCKLPLASSGGSAKRLKHYGRRTLITAAHERRVRDKEAKWILNFPMPVRAAVPTGGSARRAALHCGAC